MLPKITQKIEVHAIDENKRYSSRVADLNADYLGLDLPVDRQTGRVKPSLIDNKIVISYIGSDGNKYQYETKVIGLQKGRLSFLLTTIPDEEQISKIQMRNYLRVPSYLSIQVNASNREETPTIQAETVDISGGGLSFSCSEKIELKLNDKLVMLFNVSHGREAIHEIIAHGEVVRIDPPKREGLKQIIATEFTKVREVDRDRIIRHCFERQLDLRDKQ